jgi:coxsackievirus/adenovirus receptor
MNRLKAYHKFSIEVEFKTYADNGIILYNQQKSDGTGDFVSLAIVDGSVSLTKIRSFAINAPISFYIA